MRPRCRGASVLFNGTHHRISVVLRILAKFHHAAGAERALPRGPGCCSGKRDEARTVARALAQHEGAFGGFSSGANVAAALSLLRNQMRGKTLAALICDSGLKYLSTDLWSGVQS